MMARKITMSLSVLAGFLLVQCMVFGAMPEVSESAKKEYEQERVRIKAFEKSFTPDPNSDLKKYEEFAKGIQTRWKDGNKGLYARLMLEVCEPFNRYDFVRDYGHRRCQDLSRQYALSALADANDIPITIELELTGHVQTDMYSRYAPIGQEFSQRRAKDVQIRLHAWMRLLYAIDPNWDPNEELMSPNGVGVDMCVGASTMFSGGMDPAGIKDPELRARYEAALEANQKKIEHHSQQRRLRDWVKRFPRNAEPYIIDAYSRPPYATAELQEMLDTYIADRATRTRIMDAVKKNVAEQTKAASDKQ